MKSTCAWVLLSSLCLETLGRQHFEGFLLVITTLLRYNSHPIRFSHLKHTLQWLLVQSQSCATITTINRIFSSSPKKLITPSKYSSFPIPSLQPLATTNTLPVAMDFPILDISYKWNHTLHGPLWLASFTYMLYLYKIPALVGSSHNPLYLACRTRQSTRFQDL